MRPGRDETQQSGASSSDGGRRPEAEGRASTSGPGSSGAPVALERVVRRYFEWVVARPVPVLVAAAIVGLTLAAFIPSLGRKTSPDAFIPDGHPALKIKQQVDETFGISEPIVIGVIGQGENAIFRPDTLDLIRRLTKAVQAVPGIGPDRVTSLATESGVYFEDGEPGFELLMPEVPTDRAAIDELREEVLGYELYRGTIVAADGSAATILIDTDGEAEAERLYRVLRGLLADFETDGVELVVAGEAVVRAHMGRAVSDDALRMNFICPLVMFLMIVLAYRTARGTILPIVVIGGASAVALGSMSLAGVPVYIITNGIFVVIMALGVADSLHLMGQYYEEQLELGGRGRSRLVVDACMALWFPLLMTSLTDIAGFTALYIGGQMPPIRYFGLFTSLGVLGALVYSYTVIPAGLAVLELRMSPVFSRRRGAAAGCLDALGRALWTLGGMVARRRVAVTVISALIIGLATWGATGLIINDARVLAFGDDHPIVRATRALSSHFDGTTELHIVVSAPTPEDLLSSESLEQIAELEAFTETLPYVGGTHSVAGWIKRANQKMNDDDPESFAIPEDLFETMFYLDVLSGPGSPFADRLREVLTAERTSTNLIVRMRSSEYIHEREVVQAVEQYLATELRDGPLHAELAGRVNLDYHWLGIVRRSHIRSVAFTSICVLMLTGLMFRSVLAGLLCTLTIAVAVIINYALMALGGVPLGVGTSMFASIAIGAGVNFPIHILDRLRHRASGAGPDHDPEADIANTLAFTGRALFFTAFVVAAGFLLLMVSEFRTLVRFGLLIGTSTAISFIASVTLLPALVAIIRPRFIWGRPDPRKLES